MVLGCCAIEPPPSLDIIHTLIHMHITHTHIDIYAPAHTHTHTHVSGPRMEGGVWNACWDGSPGCAFEVLSLSHTVPEIVLRVCKCKCACVLCVCGEFVRVC